MTTAPDGGDAGAPVADDAGGERRGARAGGGWSVRRPGAVWRDTRWLGLEVLALTTFVFARPVLVPMGGSVETFITRGADWTDVLVYLVLVVAVPPLLIFAVDVVARVADPRALRPVHAVVVGCLAGLAAWQIGETVTNLSFFPLSGPVCVAVGVAAAALRLRTQALGTFLRYGSLLALVVVGQFVLTSKTGAILLGGRHVGLDAETSAAVREAVGDDGSPVVLMVFDGMPTELLMDGAGGIDAELYPHLAELAGTSTWYRNNTTVAPDTLEAVPAILSGQRPSGGDVPVASSYRHNIFTMLGDSYEVHAFEPLTALCPVTLCADDTGWPVNDLIDDSIDVWHQQMRGQDDPGFFVPGVFDERARRVDQWLNAQDFTQRERPTLHVLHALLPHDPWSYLADGSRYDTASPIPTGMLNYRWSEAGADVGRQRHILQMQLADRYVGQVTEHLRAAGAFDDALVVVTADHGYAFNDEDAVRGLTDENWDQIMWAPLLVKAPGQRAGAVDDRNVQSVDVLPTIADELGIDLSWDDLDGVPARTANRDPADKSIADWKLSDLRADDGGPVSVDGEAGLARVLAADAVPGTGPLALWDRTGGAYGELVGRSVGELAVGDPAPDPLEVVGLDRWERVEPWHPPLEVFGLTGAPPDQTVVVAVDDTVAAVVPSEPGPYGLTAVNALLWPDAVTAGHDDLAVYVVDGTRDAPVLHPVTLTNR